MSNLAEEVCWAWLRVQTELSKSHPDKEILEILYDLHRESFDKWKLSVCIKAEKDVQLDKELKLLALSDFNGSIAEKPYNFSKHIKYLLQEQKRLFNAEYQSYENRKKLGKLNKFEKALDYWERASKFLLHVFTFGVLGSSWK